MKIKHHNTALSLSIILFFLVSVFAYTHTSVQAQRGNTCGNGVCQSSQGENSSTCPSDCGGAPTPTPQPPQPTATPQITPGVTTSPNPTTSTPTDTSDSSSSSSSSSSSDSSSSTESTPPSLSLFSAPSLTNDTTPTFSGLASVSGSTISNVQYSLDGGQTWLSILPGDGSYNQSSEQFTFATSFLNDGQYTIIIRALATNGKTSNITQSFRISTVPPEINMGFITPNPSEGVPQTISGTFSRTENTITLLQVSQDGGLNWSNAQIQNNEFSYTLENLEDGNYVVIARAIDAAGNIAESNPQVLVVDTLPPVLGGSFFAIETRNIPTNKYGTMYVPTHREIQHVISTRGGVTAIEMKNNKDAKYSPVPNSHLFSGTFTFTEPGTYDIELNAVDGADNTESRTVATIIAVPEGKIINEQGETVSNATLTVYYKNPYIRSWRMWDSALYGGENPVTPEDGNYSFILPKGTYYISVDAPGYRPFVSEIITLETETVIREDITLVKSFNIPFIDSLNIPLLGRIPHIDKIDITDIPQDKIQNDPSLRTANNIAITENENTEILFSEFLESQNSDTILLTFFSSWSTQSLEQVPILNTVAQKSDIPVIGVSVQDSYYVAEVFMRRGEYSFNYIVDEDGFLSEELDISTLPYHILIKDGDIEDIRVGVLDEDEYNELINQ